MAYKGTNLLGMRRAMKELTRVPSIIAKEVAAWAGDELQAGYENGTDPYGTPWEPLAPSTIKKKGHAVINLDSGEMWANTGAKPLRGAGVAFFAIAPWGIYALAGSDRQSPRPPIPWKGLPPAWRARIQASYTGHVARAFGV